ncbi:hypothetical protein diail_2684 [Diaporthe ilicicola]|nr:hypothetical protein diail_2684 [Diaporthe ilicicola]
MTTVYIGTDGSTVTPKPTSTALPSASQRSNAQERAGIASGTVGAVLVVALLTLFCYRRSRRRVREKQGFMSISDSNSVSEAAERGDLVGQGDLFGSSETSIPSYIAVETITTNKPQIPEPAHGGTAQKDPTFERIPIYFQPSRGTVRRYPGLPSTPRPSIWRPSIRRPDYLNPVVREPALVPLPLRPGRRTPARSRSVPVWTGLRNPAREPSTVEPGAARHQVRAGGRAKSMTSSVYSSSFVGSATVGDRTSRAATTARVTSGATDATGLRSTIAEFPRPPPHTFSRSDGPGMSTTWRESFNFSALEDEVLLAFPHLARDMEGQPV